MPLSVISNAIIVVNSLPLLVFWVAVVHSRNFVTYSPIVRLIGDGATEAQKIRTAMATVITPICAPLAISLDSDNSISWRSGMPILIVLISVGLAFSGSWLCNAHRKRLDDYGRGFSNKLVPMLDAYAKENLIYLTMLIGIGVARHQGH